MDTRYEADTKIANSKRQFEMQKANFDTEVNTQVNGLTLKYSDDDFMFFFIKHFTHKFCAWIDLVDHTIPLKWGKVKRGKLKWEVSIVLASTNTLWSNIFKNFFQPPFTPFWILTYLPIRTCSISMKITSWNNFKFSLVLYVLCCDI